MKFEQMQVSTTKLSTESAASDAEIHHLVLGKPKNINGRVITFHPFSAEPSTYTLKLHNRVSNTSKEKFLAMIYLDRTTGEYSLLIDKEVKVKYGLQDNVMVKLNIMSKSKIDHVVSTNVNVKTYDVKSQESRRVTLILNRWRQDIETAHAQVHPSVTRKSARTCGGSLFDYFRKTVPI